MTDLSPRFVIEMVRSIGLLASSAQVQQRYLEQRGVAPLLDELALGLSDFVPLVPQFSTAGWLTESEVALVETLDRLLTDLTNSGDDGQWDVSSLSSQEWQQIRACASRFFTGATQ